MVFTLNQEKFVKEERYGAEYVYPKRSTPNFLMYKNVSLNGKKEFRLQMELRL